jgi:hypothetical protein
MPVPLSMYRHDWEPRPEWQAMLDAIAPPATRVPWLKLVWLAGEVYEPIQRWAIYEMIPNLGLLGPKRPGEKREETILGEFMDHPPPRWRGKWVEDPDVAGGKRWQSESLVSRLQYELFQQTRCAPSLLWIVQGANGGHLYTLPPHANAVWEREAGQSWPAPGDLPYAEPDVRTFTALLERDRLRRWEERVGHWERRYGARDGSIDWERAIYSKGQTLQEEMIELRHSSMRWLDEQMYQVQQTLSLKEAQEALDQAPSEDGDRPDAVFDEEMFG